jgi:hypothetical protein
MDGGFSGPVDVQYYANGTAGQRYVLKPADVSGTFRREGVKVYKLKKAGATITANTAMKIDTTDATGATVVPTAAATDIPLGVSPIAVTSGNYFFMQISGNTTLTLKTGVTAGNPISASATAGAGQKAPFTAATIQGVLGVALVDNSSGIDADTAVRLHGLH